MVDFPRPKAPPRRRQLRLPGYDYSLAGAYFVTICSHDRHCVFGAIVDGEVRPSRLGRLVAESWLSIPSHFPPVATDTFVVMPNHVHGILLFSESAGCQLPAVIAGFNAGVSKRAGRSIWQRNYYEHIVRSEASLNRIRRYIDHNPLNWGTDRENPRRPRVGLV